MTRERRYLPTVWRTTGLCATSTCTSVRYRHTSIPVCRAATPCERAVKEPVQCQLLPSSHGHPSAFPLTCLNRHVISPFPSWWPCPLQIGDAGIIALATSLIDGNTTLETLDIGSNRFGSEAVSTLWLLIRSSATLRKVSLRNRCVPSDMLKANGTPRSATD